MTSDAHPGPYEPQHARSSSTRVSHSYATRGASVPALEDVT